MFQNQLLSLLLDFCFVYKEQKFVSKVNQTNSRFCIQLIQRIEKLLKLHKNDENIDRNDVCRGCDVRPTHHSIQRRFGDNRQPIDAIVRVFQ